MGKNIQKEPKTSVFDSFLTESVISVNVDGAPQVEFEPTTPRLTEARACS